MKEAATANVERSAQDTPVYCWDTSGKKQPSDFNPIPNSEAVRRVHTFRKYEKKDKEKHLHEYGYGVIHRPAAMMNYLTNVFCTIVEAQPPLGAEFKDYSWGMGHFFMMDENEDIGYCVAPILFKKSEATPKKTDVLDPFDKNCPYQYTYGVNALGDSEQTGDDEEWFYDMGEMWP